MTASSRAPGNYWTRLLTAGMLMQSVILNGPAYIPASKLPAIAAAVLAACDAMTASRMACLTTRASASSIRRF